MQRSRKCAEAGRPLRPASRSAQQTASGRLEAMVDSASSQLQFIAARPRAAPSAGLGLRWRRAPCGQRPAPDATDERSASILATPPVAPCCACGRPWPRHDSSRLRPRDGTRGPSSSEHPTASCGCSNTGRRSVRGWGRALGRGSRCGLNRRPVMFEKPLPASPPACERGQLWARKGYIRLIYHSISGGSKPPGALARKQ